MSALRKYLKRPQTYLAVLAAMVLLGLADSFRAPADQITARVYIGGVYLYQKTGRPLLEGYVRCRYRPTCSDYSIEAVERYGIGRGLVLTFKRVSSCKSSVAPGAEDPVPSH